MKTNQKILTVLLIASICFYGCQEQEKTIQSDKYDFDQIGMEHNKGLDRIFRDLKEAKASSTAKISTVDYLDLATESGTQFVLTGHPDLPTDMVQTFKEQASRSNTFFKNYLSARSSNSQES